MDNTEALAAAHYISARLVPAVLGDDDLCEALLRAPAAALEPLICLYYPELDGEERAALLPWVDYNVRYQLHAHAQTKALPLLRRVLPASCTRRLRKEYGHVEVVGSAGGRYRIYAYGSCIERVFEHNGRWYGAVRYCYHDPHRVLCPADHALAIALMLLADEPQFLDEANPSLWESSYRKLPKNVDEQARVVIHEWKQRRAP